MQITLVPTAPVISTPAGDRILTAATRLFSQDGITATGVERIVEAAGTTKRTLYQRFGSKDALVAAYLQQRAHQWQSDLIEALNAADRSADPQTALDVVFDQAERWSTNRARGCAFVNAWAEIGATKHPAVGVVEAEKLWMRQLFTGLASGDTEKGMLIYMLYEGAQVAVAIDQNSAAFTIARCAAANLIDE